jgi:hypothetical protein
MARVQRCGDLHGLGPASSVSQQGLWHEAVCLVQVSALVVLRQRLG